MKKLTKPQAKAILLRYYLTPPEKRRHMVRELEEEFGISGTAVRDVLKGKNHADVLPEIPRDFGTGHGMTEFPDHVVQAIRATYDAYPELHGEGLEAALARHFGMSLAHLCKITKRKARIEVEDNPGAVIDKGELPFKDLHPGNSKLEHSEAVEIHRLFHEEGLSRSEIASRFGVTPSCVGMILSGASRVKAYEEYHGHPPDRN